MPSRRVVPIVLCGGSGSRLWPLSRKTSPKPFIALPGRDRTLIEDTYRRVTNVGDNGKGDNNNDIAAVITVTAAEHAFLCDEHYRAAAGDHAPPHIIISEPLPCNTAPAIAVAAAVAQRRFGDDVLLAVLPADHLIHDVLEFKRLLNVALTEATNCDVALLGISPTHPATGYGYIECEKTDAAEVFKIRRFVEKPDLATAQQFLTAGNFFWNAGMFCFSAAAAMRLLQQHAPDIHTLLPAVLESVISSDSATSANTVSATAEAYRRFPAVSFDYAVMEKTDNAVVVRAADLGWSDIGSWSALADQLPADATGNRAVGDAHLHDCANTFVSATADRLVVGIGLKDLHIVDSPDALLVSASKDAENVRVVYDKLTNDGRTETTTPTTVRRPWGTYTVLTAGAGYKVKRIEVLPGAQLSLQSHEHRSEHWTTVAGIMGIVINDREFDMAIDESCHIPLGAKHRMHNQGTVNAAVIEVQIGNYLEEDDIIRYEDIYGRVGG